MGFWGPMPILILGSKNTSDIGISADILCVYYIFGRVPQVQFIFQGLNITLLESLQPADMKNNPQQQC